MEWSPKVLSQDTVCGANSLSTLGMVVKPIFKSQAVCVLLLFKDIREKEFHLEVRAAYEILVLF